MPDLSKAKQHHAHAGAALAKGDAKKAAHHFGHALAALRANTGTSSPTSGEAEPDPDANPWPPTQTGSRARSALSWLNTKSSNATNSPKGA